MDQRDERKLVEQTIDWQEIVTVWTRISESLKGRFNQHSLFDFAIFDSIYRQNQAVGSFVLL